LRLDDRVACRAHVDGLHMADGGVEVHASWVVLLGSWWEGGRTDGRMCAAPVI
jgi:hypothetical protein